MRPRIQQPAAHRVSVTWPWPLSWPDRDPGLALLQADGAVANGSQGEGDWGGTQGWTDRLGWTSRFPLVPLTWPEPQGVPGQEGRGG